MRGVSTDDINSYYAICRHAEEAMSLKKIMTSSMKWNDVDVATVSQTDQKDASRFCI